MSDSVMEAIANTLQLNASERLHPYRLAWPAQVARQEAAAPEHVRPSVLAITEGMTEQAVLVVGRRTDLLGGNRLGFARHGAAARPAVEHGEDDVPEAGHARPFRQLGVRGLVLADGVR